MSIRVLNCWLLEFSLINSYDVLVDLVSWRRYSLFYKTEQHNRNVLIQN